MKPMDTNRSLRRIQLAGYLSLFAMAGTLGGWSVFADLNGAVIAPATIVVESYSKKVQHRDGGIVQKILVRDGERVTLGQDMVILDPTETRAELAIVDGLLDELTIKRLRLEAQRDGLTSLILPSDIEARANDPKVSGIISGQRKFLQAINESAASKRNQLNEQISQLTEQMLGIDAQNDSKNRQLSIIAGELTNLRKLQKQGLVPLNRVLTMEREVASIEGQSGELLASKAGAQSKIGEVKLQILQVDEDIRTQALNDLRDVEGKITELQERRISANTRMGRMVVKAPITGTIYQTSVHTEGGVIAPGETMMLIVPEGDDLVLQAQIQPQDISKVHEKLTAQVRFPSFNSRLTPEVTATVTQVAADTSRIDANTPPFYAVRLEISAEELAKLGDNKLRPGMNAEAFIQTGARSPLSYLVKPFTDNLAHALREP